MLWGGIFVHSYSKKMKFLVLITLAILVVTPLRPYNSSASSDMPIQHVVVIMQENHTFDSFFWTYPGVVGGIDQNSTYCLPANPNKPTSSTNPCYRPIPFTSTVPSGDLPHSANAANGAYD